MADKKISDLDALAAVDLDTTNDLFAVVDTSATQTKKISVGEVLGNLSTLNAIDTSITATAVDVFVYDTSKDSDGGAWRKRCQHTSWYNEPLNTATRGSRREFPAVAVIVAEASKVTIYDGDDPSLPMWMVFQGSYNFATGKMLPVHLAPETNISSIVAKNASLLVGSKPGTLDSCGLVWIDFISDKATFHNQYSSDTGLFKGAIAQRNSGVGWSGNQPLPKLVSSSVNDVSITILPDAPTDSATGLPVPTIAVATDGGVSVIKDDGTVVDSTQTFKMSQVLFDADDTLVFSHGHQAGVIGARVYISTNGVDPTAVTIYGNTSNQIPRLFKSSGSGELFSDVVSLGSDLAVGNDFLNTYLSLFSPDPTTPANGMVAYTTSTYNTGWMNGDIKLATLSDTDATNVTGGNLLTGQKSTYDVDTSTPGWNTQANATVSHSSGNGNGGGNAVAVTSSGGSNIYATLDTGLSLTIGKQYILQFDIRNSSGTAASVVNASQNAFQSGTVYGNILDALDNLSTTYQTVYFTFTATTASLHLNVYAGLGNNVAIYLDNIQVYEAEKDRSVNNNGLQVFGSITKSAVATGAELVAYSGFSASNYLEQPYNPDLDFGTGDFCVMGWFNQNSNGHNKSLLDRAPLSLVTGDKFFRITRWADGRNVFELGTYYVDSEGVQFTDTSLNNWYFLVGLRRNGVLEIYQNGVLRDTASSVTDVSQANAVLRLGRGTYDGVPMALVRISATAPTAEQIKKIYEDEKFLFQDNAACTLYGASDAVTALAHDPDTDLLHVGTSAGRSVFQGLRRVDNTTTAVETAISASGALVVEE